MSSTTMEAEKLVRIAEILKTIAHPVRLEILQTLREQESLCVGELQKAVETDVEQSMLSHHLIKMKDKGVLQCEKKGMHVYYSICDRDILNIFDCMSNCTL